MIRSLGLLSAALAINLGLIVIMDNMVSKENPRVVELLDSQTIDFVRTQFDEETQTKDRRTPPPPKPQQIDRPRAALDNIVQRASSMPTEVAAFEVTSLLAEGTGIGLGRSLTEGAVQGSGLGRSLIAGSVQGLDLMMADDLIPLTMLPPQYPAQARIRGTEGWVEMLFTVTRQGTVENPTIIESEPPGLFDEAAKNAAMRWRFRPVVRNGQSIDIMAKIHVNFSISN